MQPERIGPYRLERKLGEGGMGVVYAAWDERLDRRVALKQIRPEIAGASLRERFRREARAVAQLDHPSIVRIYDLLETPESDWIVLQYVEGPTLAQRLRQGPLPPAQVATVARDILGALAAAHSRNLLHRDLKTENVVLALSGHALVLDFGLAKLYAGSGAAPGETLPGTAGVVGTYRAMSPEQANGYDLDPRSDLFSLGVLLYEAATGISPFQAATPVATMTRVCTHRQPPAHELVPDVPEDLSALIDELLEKDADRRPQSAVEVIAWIDSGSVAAEIGLDFGKTISGAPRDRFPSVPSAAVFPSDPNRPASAAPYRSLRSRHLPLVAGLALGALGVAVLLLRLGQSAHEPLYVVVAPPVIGSGTATADDEPERLAAAALDAALLRSLASLDGIVALPADLTEGNATPQRLAQIHAADEVLSSSLDCAARQCLVTLRRQRGTDGHVLGVQTFEIPADDVRLLSTAADSYLKAGYAGFASRRGTRGLDVRTEDYVRFLALQRRSKETRPADLAPLLAELAEIRAGSPLFIDAYLLEARLTHRRFFETRDAIDLDRSFALIDQARNLAPGDTLPYVVLFEVALGADRLDQAVAAAEELERLVPGDIGALHRRAFLAEARNEGPHALELLREVAGRRPAARYLMDLAKMELRQGEAAAARATLEDLLRRIPGQLGGERLLAQLELQSGSPERAAELYTHLLRRRRGFTELSNLGVARLLLSDWKGAAASLEEAYALAPNNAQAALNLADAMTLAGRRDEASTLYARVIDLAEKDPAPGFWQTLTVKAQALAHLGRAPEAAAAIQRATAAAPDNPQLAYEAALVYSLIGDRASAQASAEHAVSGGVDRRGFALPFFDSLRGTPAWAKLFAAPEKSAATPPPPPADR